LGDISPRERVLGATWGYRGMSALILVVDDEPALANAVAHFLEDEGYRVRVARDGLTAFELAVREPPDLILSDVHMPHLDGPALVRRLRAIGRAVPVVLMSAVYSGTGHADVRFVPKPFDLDHLLVLIQEALDHGTAACETN
jgi:two-component system response regulator MprA